MGFLDVVLNFSELGKLGGFSMGGAGAWHTPPTGGAGFVLSDKAREYFGDFWRRYDSAQSQVDFGAAERAPPHVTTKPIQSSPQLDFEAVVRKERLFVRACFQEKALWGGYDVPDYPHSAFSCTCMGVVRCDNGGTMCRATLGAY